MKKRIQYYPDKFIVQYDDHTREFAVDWFVGQFVDLRRTHADLAKEMGIRVSLLYDIAKYYHIKRGDILQYDDSGVKYRGKMIDIATIRRVYIEENHEQREAARLLGLPHDILTEICAHYGLYKSVAEREELRCRTNQQKYGYAYLLQVPEFAERRRATMLEHWGATSAYTSDKWRDQRGAQNSGAMMPSQDHISHLDEWNNDSTFINNLRVSHQTAQYWAEYYNVQASTILIRANELDARQYIKAAGGTSKYEKELCMFLHIECGISNEEIKRHVRRGIFQDRREVDIYLPQYRIGIEFNGDFWHSSASAKYQDHNGRSRYHQQKSLDALKAGVFLFHIFEYEWKDPNKKKLIQERLKTILGCHTRRIGARKCAIAVLTKAQKKEFLNANHLQGNDRSTVAIGLTYGDELVACMSFVRAKNSQYDWELSRFCCLCDCVVPGGASRLLHWFEQNYATPGEKIVSYNDISKTRGEIYRTLSFERIGVNPPNYIWINFHTNDIKTRYQTQMKNEHKMMTNAGYYQICDSGTITWVRTVPERR